MFKDEFQTAAGAASAKVTLLQKNPAGYVSLSLLAGMYIGFGILLAFTIGGLLTGQPYAKIVMGAAFGVALSLVVIAGAELFTGNNMVMTAGLFQKTIPVSGAIKLWIVCFLGNWIGSIILGVLYHYSGLATPEISAAIGGAALAKMSAPAVQLFIRGILCNILVCLAVWCGFRSKSDSGKLIMVFWCLLAFFTTGFEHCIANMTLLTVAVMNPGELAISVSGYLYNILFVTAGNMVGGICFVAFPYWLSARER